VSRCLLPVYCSSASQFPSETCVMCLPFPAVDIATHMYCCRLPASLCVLCVCPSSLTSPPVCTAAVCMCATRSSMCPPLRSPIYSVAACQSVCLPVVRRPSVRPYIPDRYARTAPLRRYRACELTGAQIESGWWMTPHKTKQHANAQTFVGVALETPTQCDYTALRVQLQGQVGRSTFRLDRYMVNE
jgi:hypothetical protein